LAGEAAAPVLDAHPGQFFVALGLALQALGMGDIALDLTPQEKAGLLTLDLTKSLALGRKCTAAWGLDLSGSALKAIKLVAEGSAVQIAAAEFLQGQSPLAQFAERAGDLKGTRIAAGLPGQRVLGRFFELPPMPAKKLTDAIAYEAGHQLPIPLAELCWASHVQDAPEGSAADQSPRRILVVAARASYVRERIGTFHAAGIRPDLLTADCLALHNALVHEMFARDIGARPRAAIGGLDVGAANTNMVISSPRSVWFRTIGVGGDQFTAQLVRQFGLTQDEAEQLKREPAKARRYSTLRDALQPTLAQLASEVDCSLATYAKLFPEYSVRQLYGLGGAFQTHGLLRQLRRGN
jgi:type IV pilus assembly protein PilM